MEISYVMNNINDIIAERDFLKDKLNRQTKQRKAMATRIRNQRKALRQQDVLVKAGFIISDTYYQYFMKFAGNEQHRLKSEVSKLKREKNILDEIYDYASKEEERLFNLYRKYRNENNLSSEARYLELRGIYSNLLSLIDKKRREIK